MGCLVDISEVWRLGLKGSNGVFRDMVGTGSVDALECSLWYKSLVTRALHLGLLINLVLVECSRDEDRVSWRILDCV